MIRVEDLTVTFGGVRALDALTVELRGDVVGVIGPNGAGKTTLLNVMSGFVVARSGLVELWGTQLLELSPHRRARWGLRRTFQTEQIVDELCVGDNVAIALDNTEFRGNRRERLRSALSLVGLEDRWRHSVTMLDGFERRLVEVARSVVGNPRLILMDEPGGGLTSAETKRLAGIILQVPEATGASVMLIDHDVDLIAETCDQTACFDFGRLISAGPTRDVLTDALVRAAYLGVEVVAG